MSAKPTSKLMDIDTIAHPFRTPVSREALQAERARWRPQAKASPSLRLVRGGGEAAARAYNPADDGHPTVIGRVNGYPLEHRHWDHRPAGFPDAIYVQPGYWVCVRILD